MTQSPRLDIYESPAPQRSTRLDARHAMRMLNRWQGLAGADNTLQDLRWYRYVRSRQNAVVACGGRDASISSFTAQGYTDQA